jgi:hypothetical protein
MTSDSVYNHMVVQGPAFFVFVEGGFVSETPFPVIIFTGMVGVTVYKARFRNAASQMGAVSHGSHGTVMPGV